MKAYDYLMKGFVDVPGYNCCERILIAANEAYGLELPPEAIRIGAGFGGGMCIGSVCGALTGAVMALSSRLVSAHEQDEPRIRPLTARLLNQYEQQMGAIDCHSLKERYYTSDGRCRDIILAAARLLDQAVEEAQQEAGQ